MGNNETNNYLGGLEYFLEGCWSSRKLIYLAAITFSCPFGELSGALVLLSFSVKTVRKLILLVFYPLVSLFDRFVDKDQFLIGLGPFFYRSGHLR